MSINDKLLSLSFDEIYQYDMWSEDLEEFINFEGDFLGRQQLAIDTIQLLMTLHGKQDLLGYVSKLAEIEHGIQELQPWQRDHVVHALNSFILGIYINEKFLKKSLNVGLGKFEWKLAGLMHDTGYPLEIAMGISKQFTDKVNEIRNEIGIDREDVFCKIVPLGLDKLQNGIKSFDLISERILSWDININAEEEFELMKNDGKVCHGIISAIAVLYVIDMLYEKFNPNRLFEDTFGHDTNINWNQHYFVNDVVSSCAAIFLHNLRNDRFENTKIDPYKAPLAFLLKLSDVMQDWDRPSLLDIKGYNVENFNIEVVDGNLHFKVKPDIKGIDGVRRIDSIRNDLESTIVMDNIVIEEF